MTKLDKAAIDALGFVPFEEVTNIMTEAMRELDEQVWPVGTAGSRAHLIQWADSLKYRLLNRAKHNIDEFISRNATVRQSARDEKAKAEEDKNRQTWQDRVAKRQREW